MLMQLVSTDSDQCGSTSQNPLKVVPGSAPISIVTLSSESFANEVSKTHGNCTSLGYLHVFHVCPSLQDITLLLAFTTWQLYTLCNNVLSSKVHRSKMVAEPKLVRTFQDFTTDKFTSCLNKMSTRCHILSHAFSKNKVSICFN